MKKLPLFIVGTAFLLVGCSQPPMEVDSVEVSESPVEVDSVEVPESPDDHFHCRWHGQYCTETVYLDNGPIFTRIYKEDQGEPNLLVNSEFPLTILTEYQDVLFLARVTPETDAPIFGLFSYRVNDPERTTVEELSISNRFGGFNNYRISPDGSKILVSNENYEYADGNYRSGGGFLSILDLINDKEIKIEDFPIESDFTFDSGEEVFGGYDVGIEWVDNRTVEYQINKSVDSEKVIPYEKRTFTLESN